jgi:serine/threonine protein kinase
MSRLPNEPTGPPDQIGHYKILETLGEGGFGVVYLAEQTETVKRQVALKVIKPGMDTQQVISRFEAERQALAVMDHPNIARVFDGGVTEQGRPYFVMELVRGLPVTEYCDIHKLSIREQLVLRASRAPKRSPVGQATLTTRCSVNTDAAREAGRESGHGLRSVGFLRVVR